MEKTQLQSQFKQKKAPKTYRTIPASILLCRGTGAPTRANTGARFFTLLQIDVPAHLVGRLVRALMWKRA